MGQIKHKMGNVGGGVDISHKSKMSGKAKSLMSFPGGMPGPGDYGNMDPRPGKIVGRGMAKYLAGESVGMRKMDPMHNGKPGVQQEDFEQFSAPDSTGPAKRSRAQRQEDRDAAKTKRRAGRADKRVTRNKAKVKKLQDKIDGGKENFNVDEAGNKTTGRKADRIARAKKKITDNEKISKKGKDLKKIKGEEKAKKVTAQIKNKENKTKEDSKVIMERVNAAFDKNKNVPGGKNDPGGEVTTEDGVRGQRINGKFVALT